MWPDNREELLLLQNRLGAADFEPWDPQEPVRLIGGCFVCYPKKHPGKGAAGDRYWAAAACTRDTRIAALEVVRGETAALYEPGLLALREGPLLESAVRRLPEMPEVLLVNATGRDHPRRAGLALHLGFNLSLPTIGVTRNPLQAGGDWPEDLSGAAAPLRIDGETVGYWLRVRKGAQPLVVHAAWRTSPETALRIVRGLAQRWRTPEPLRQARRAAREARARDLRLTTDD